MSGLEKLAASGIAALIAVTGCAVATPKKSAQEEERETAQIDRLAASSPRSESAAPPSAKATEGNALRDSGEAKEGARGAEKPVEKEEGPRRQGGGIAAVEGAAEAKKYLFIFFRRDDDEQTRKMARVLDAAMKRVDGRAEQITIDVSDPSERDIVKKFGVDRAPMPLVLVLAPNGAVTGGFPVRFEEKQLTEAIVGPGTASVLKALQDGKLAFVCVQNSRTTSNAAAMRGVKDFAADARYAKSTEIVTFDPTAAAEAKFLGQIKIDPKTRKATTVLLAPPGTIVGKFEGATAKDKLIAALEACGTGCGPSSGST